MFAHGIIRGLLASRCEVVIELVVGLHVFLELIGGPEVVGGLDVGVGVGIGIIAVHLGTIIFISINQALKHSSTKTAKQATPRQVA